MFVKLTMRAVIALAVTTPIEEITNWSSLSDLEKKIIFQRIENMNTSKQKVFSSNQND